MQDIYIRVFSKATIIAQKQVRLKDVAQISAPSSLKTQIEGICILTPQAQKKTNYLITITDIINLVTNQFANISINSIGEMDVIVEYFPTEPKKNKILEWIKVVVACTIIFSGSSVAIMAYHTDTSLAKTFTALNRIFTNKSEENPLFITVPYCIGLPIGSLLFFNHIGKKKLTDDPTPIQIEVNKYEQDVENTIVETLTENKRSKK